MGNCDAQEKPFQPFFLATCMCLHRECMRVRACVCARMPHACVRPVADLHAVPCAGCQKRAGAGVYKGMVEVAKAGAEAGKNERRGAGNENEM